MQLLLLLLLFPWEENSLSPIVLVQLQVLLLLVPRALSIDMVVEAPKDADDLFPEDGLVRGVDRLRSVGE